VSTVKKLLEDFGVLGHVTLPPALDILLEELDVTTGFAPDPSHDPSSDPNHAQILTGGVTLGNGFSQSPLPGFDFGLAIPTDIVEGAPCKLRLWPEPNPTSFQFWIALAEQGQVRSYFELFDKVPGLSLIGADLKPD
jgi:hypothetical protein